MAGTRMSMRKIREVLRLTHELGLTVRQVREATGVGKTAVSALESAAFPRRTPTAVISTVAMRWALLANGR
jgi:hypothetical protein